MRKIRRLLKVFLIVAFIFIICTVSTVIYVKSNQPLGNGSGMVKFPEYYLNNSYKNCIILEVENKGLFDVEVEEVYINDRVTPSKVELGISKTLHHIDGTDDNEFYDINERYKISAKPDTKKIKEILQQDKNNTVINYGIRIYDNSPIEKVIIKYTYLGISFQYIEENREIRDFSYEV